MCYLLTNDDGHAFHEYASAADKELNTNFQSWRIYTPYEIIVCVCLCVCALLGTNRFNKILAVHAMLSCLESQHT